MTVLRRSSTGGRTAGRSSDGILAQDRLLELAQGGARLEAELLDERAARVLVGRERVGLAAGAVEREHELAAQALVGTGAARRERLELGDEVGVAAELELGVDQVLPRREAELLEPRDLGRANGS